MARLFMRALLPAERVTYFLGMLPLWGGALEQEQFVPWQRRLAESPEAANRYRLLGLFDAEQPGVGLLAALKGYAFEGSCEGRALLVLGIGAVFTPPPLRNRGHAARLLHLALEDARARGMHAALLFSDIGARYYEQFGFQLLESLECHLEPRQLPRASGCRATGPGDESLVSRILAAGRNQTGPFSLSREGWVLRFQLRRLRELARVRNVGEPEWGLVLEHKSGEAAAMVRHTAEALDVLDCAWTTTAARDRLLGGLRDCALRSSRPRIRFWPVHQVRGLFASSPRATALAMLAPLISSLPLPAQGGRAELTPLDHI